MIKLTDLINELERPKQIYASEYKPEKTEDDFIKKGFKLGEPEINPETGTVTTSVQYLPKFEEIRRDLIKKRKEFQPFKFSSNPDIAKLSKDINTNLTKLNNMIYALEGMIKLQKG